ncbi:MAG: N-6 DNA methylase [Planctomycetota bacterium]
MAGMQRRARPTLAPELSLLPTQPLARQFLSHLEREFVDPVSFPPLFAKTVESCRAPPTEVTSKKSASSPSIRPDIAMLYYGLLCRSLLLVATGTNGLRSLDWQYPSHALDLGWLDDHAERLSKEQLDTLVSAWWRSGNPRIAGDPLRQVFEELVPGDRRRHRGEFYTPDWLADRVVDAVWDRGRTWLDPCCGSGGFAWAIARRAMREADGDWHYSGLDQNPWSVLAAATNSALAQAFVRTEKSVGDFTIPVACMDVVVDPALPVLSRSLDRIVGNPPWLLWDRMEDSYRKATEPFWRHYGLFAESGMRTILGGGKKDLAMLVTYAAADRYLASAGKLAFVITQSVFKSAGSARGFRRFELPDGRRLSVRRVDDIDSLRPFPKVGAKAAVLVLEIDSPTSYPVPYRIWDRHGNVQDHEAWPADEQDPLGAWKHVPAEAVAVGRNVLGPCEYQARLGVNTGGANGVYWFECLQSSKKSLRLRNLVGRGKRTVEPKEVDLERAFLFPLLIGKDVLPWSAVPSAWTLMVQDPEKKRGVKPEILRESAPDTWNYLRSFEPLLRERAAFKRYFVKGTEHRAVEKGAFYSMFNVGPYTLARVKVVWNRMGHQLAAAVVTEHENQPILPQETHCFFPCDSEEEAHYLAALLNSPAAQAALEMIGQVGGKSFATPSTMHRLRLQRFESENPLHQSLSNISKAAHREAAGPPCSYPSRETLLEVERLACLYWDIDRT